MQKLKLNQIFILNPTVYMKYLKMFSTEYLGKLLNKIFKCSEYKTELSCDKGNLHQPKMM